jgi:hypothetical protein
LSRDIPRPYLITKDEDGSVRLTLRETRFNGQGYPLVTETRLEESFKTAAAARNHAKEHFGAEAGQFATK